MLNLRRLLTSQVYGHYLKSSSTHLAKRINQTSSTRYFSSASQLAAMPNFMQE